MKNRIYLLTFLALLFLQATQAATINFGPNGCTLQDAIRSANADAPRGNCSAGSGYDFLISPDFWDITLSSTLPTISSDMTISTQTSTGLLTIRGNDNHRIMKVTGNETNLTLQRVQLTEGWLNSVIAVSGGAAMKITDATVTLLDSYIDNNQSNTSRGGGIYMTNARLFATNTRFLNNTAYYSNSRIELVDSEGGSIWAKNSTLEITQSKFASNQSKSKHRGEGNEEWIVNNIGASMYIDAGSLIFDRSLITETYSGIYAKQSNLVLINSTIVKSPVNQFEKMLNIYNFSTVEINHLTTTAPILIDYSSIITSVTNSIFNHYCQVTDNIIFASQNMSVSSHPCVGGGFINLNGPDEPLFLADNGGFTETVALRHDSLAINAGDSSFCLPTDQRGEDRDGSCDVGAYEATGFVDLEITHSIEQSPPYVKGQQIIYRAIITNNSLRVADDVKVDLALNNAFFNSTNSLFCSSFPCIIPVLQPLQEIEIPIVLNLSGSQSNFSITLDINSTSDSTFTDNITSNNTDFYEFSPLTAGADLGIEMHPITFPPYFIGQTVKYLATVTNYGSATATSVGFHFNPTNLTNINFTGCDSFAGQNCFFNALGNSTSKVITVSTQITASQFDAQGTVSSAQTDINLDNNLDNQLNNGAVTDTDISVSMTLLQAPPYHSYQYLEFDITISTGNEPASNIKLWPEFSGAEFIEIDFCSIGYPCLLPDMAANTTRHITAKYFAPIIASSSETFTHSILVTSGQSDTNITDNLATFSSAIVASADVAVSLNLITPGPYYVGQDVEYQLHSRNSGPNLAHNFDIRAFTQNLTLSFAVGNLCSTVTCIISEFEPFSVENITLVYRIDSEGPFGLVATTYSDEFDPQTSNNSAGAAGDGVAILIQPEIMFVDGFE